MFIVMRNDYNEPYYFSSVSEAVLYVEQDLIPKIKAQWECRDYKFTRRGNGWAVDGGCCLIRIEKVTLWQSVLKLEK